VLKGVSAVFYAYIGFDAISTTAEECQNPQRDLPRGMLYSLLICTVIYIITALVITGMVPYFKFEHVTDPLAFVFNYVGQEKLGKFISFSAVVAATSVLLVFQIGQPRIWMSMSRDGLLPKAFSKMHKKFKTPYIATIIAGAFVAIPSLFINIDIVTDLTSIGTLFAFVIVCAGVLTLAPALPEQRFKLPYINGRFILPILLFVFIGAFSERISQIINTKDWLFLIFLISTSIITIFTIKRKWSLIPILGLLCCMYLMIEIPVNCWKVFIVWMLIGLTIYFFYGYKKSKLNTLND
jgi:amino acid transporter